MGLPLSTRVKRPLDAVRTDHEAPPRVVTVFRLPDNTICHGRCGHSLALQGVRAGLEADFYCFACLTHVTLPLAVLDNLPVIDDPAQARANAVPRPEPPGRSAPPDDSE